MSSLTDPSRYVGRLVGYLDGNQRIEVRVLAVGSGGVLIDHPDGRRLVVPADLHDLQAPPLEPSRHHTPEDSSVRDRPSS